MHDVVLDLDPIAEALAQGDALFARILAAAPVVAPHRVADIDALGVILLEVAFIVPEHRAGLVVGKLLVVDLQRFVAVAEAIVLGQHRFVLAGVDLADDHRVGRCPVGLVGALGDVIDPQRGIEVAADLGVAVSLGVGGEGKVLLRCLGAEGVVGAGQHLAQFRARIAGIGGGEGAVGGHEDQMIVVVQIVVVRMLIGLKLADRYLVDVVVAVSVHGQGQLPGGQVEDLRRWRTLGGGHGGYTEGGDGQGRQRDDQGLAKGVSKGLVKGLAKGMAVGEKTAEMVVFEHGVVPCCAGVASARLELRFNIVEDDSLKIKRGFV